MGTNIVETVQIGNNTYRVVLLDNKYTVYVQEKEQGTTQGDSEPVFSALASFNSLEEARIFLKTKKGSE